MEYRELVSAVLEENRQVLQAVDPRAVDQLVDEILKAKSVHLYAMGRMQLSVRAFAMRLTHMGIPTYVVFDTTSRRIGPGDLLIGHCAVTNVELNVVQLSKEAGARIVLLTAHPENEHGKLADLCVRVPGQIFGGPNEVKSIQPMASLLEQALFHVPDEVFEAAPKQFSEEELARLTMAIRSIQWLEFERMGASRLRHPAGGGVPGAQGGRRRRV